MVKINRSSLWGWVAASLCMVLLIFYTPSLFSQDRRTERVISVSQFVLHPAMDALLRGFKEYLQSKDLAIRYNVHVANGDQSVNVAIPGAVAKENPDLVLTISTPSSQACFRSLPNSIILFSAVTDPVGAGLVEDLNKPGPNITGMTDMSPVERHIALIVDLQPKLKRLGVLYNAKETNSLSLVKLIEKECNKRGIELIKETIDKRESVTASAERLVGQCDAIYVPTDNTVVAEIEAVARICGRNRLPLYVADVESVPRGAVVSLAIDYYSMGRQTAKMAERILLGEKPSAIPVESLEDYRIHVNVKAAELMGVDLPVSLLQSADVIYDSFPQ